MKTYPTRHEMNSMRTEDALIFALRILQELLEDEWAVDTEAPTETETPTPEQTEGDHG